MSNESSQASPWPRSLERTLLLQGRVFDVVRERIVLASGREQDLTIVEHPGAVCVAPLREDGRLLCVRQYRHAVRRHLLEIPAGRLETGEVPLQAAQRELEEETGLRAKGWRELAHFFAAPGFCSERLTLFVATQLYPVSPTDGRRLVPDDDEEFELEWVAPKDLLDGAAEDAKSLLAASLLLLGR